jgi:hypothetical protein
MPRFYFHLYNDLVAMDEEGRDFPDLDAARAMAVCEAREMMSETVMAGRITLDHRIDVADETGKVLATVMFRDAVAIDG